MEFVCLRVCQNIRQMGTLRESVGAGLVVIFLLVPWVLVHVFQQKLLLGTTTCEFNVSNARRHLENITSVGPRPMGSPENEVLTVNYLLTQVERIRAETDGGPHSISVDVQRPTGSVFLGGSIHCYDRITNVVVRLEPEGGAEHLMLANCHFDTVPDSPGASDDAVNCAVMLEVLRSMALQHTPMKHGVVFLFNGAEENAFQASHGFITQHPWAKQVRAFLNLEAAGVGGKELVFQTGPENPWLIQAYAEAAHHPFASVVGQEIFQSGIIPSDTDFFIFRDFGKIPGIDMAFIENGFLYHTKFDTPDRIPNDSIQRAGDNVLAVLKHLVMSEKLANSSVYQHGNMVYFDLLGIKMWSYPAWVGILINCTVAILTIVYLASRHFVCHSDGHRYMQEMMCALQGTLCSWIVAFVAVLLVSGLVIASGRSMFWYSHFYAATCLYGAAATLALLLSQTYWRSCERRCLHDLGGLFFDATLSLWCLILVVMTSVGSCSAYVPMLMLAFPLCSRLLLRSRFTSKGASVKYLVLYLLSLVLPYTHLMSLNWIILEMITPTLGRFGHTIPPDIVLALLIALATILLSSFLTHFIYVVRGIDWVLRGLGALLGVMLLLVLCGAFFPYTDHPASPRPKRLFLQHTTNTIQGSNLWFTSVDYTGMQHVTSHVPEITASASPNRWYVPAPPYSPQSPMEFRLVSKQKTEWATLNLTFEVKGPSRMAISMSLHPGASLASWSLNHSILECSHEGQASILYSHGLDTPAWRFWFEIQSPGSAEGSDLDGVVSMAILSHYFFGADHRTAALDSMLLRLPSWTFTSAWVSTYHTYHY